MKGNALKTRKCSIPITSLAKLISTLLAVKDKPANMY